MNELLRVRIPFIVAGALICACGRPPSAADTMSFFVTSVPAGNGGNMSGLAGADAHCQSLAQTVGSGKRTWRAYLSAAADGGRPAVNARDRIGLGPWFNAKGVLVAASLEDLHEPNNSLGERTSLDELGEAVGYYHDMMTGSNPDGTLAGDNLTCRNWTSLQGRAMVGHSNRQGLVAAIAQPLGTPRTNPADVRCPPSRQWAAMPASTVSPQTESVDVRLPAPEKDGRSASYSIDTSR